MKLTLKVAKAELNGLGISIHKIAGEYKVYPKGTIGQAYFTDDIADAVGTGRLMAGKTARPTLADAHKLHGQMEFRSLTARRYPTDDKFAVIVNGRRVKAMATRYGNWYGYVGGRNVKMFFGDYVDQQFDAFDWIALLGQANSLATL